MNPTTEFYSSLQAAYSFFNKTLFDEKLPNCLITVQRQKNVMGYFAAGQWANREGQYAHEIALNPGYFGHHRLIEVFQTLVHEQCHLWQHVLGKAPRRGYHNREWADKMLSIGLAPSSTGLPGGKQTGQTMSDYPVPDGKFQRACVEFVKQKFALPWVDCFPALRESAHIRDHSELSLAGDDQEIVLLETRLSELVPEVKSSKELTQQRQKKQKTAYACQNCKYKVWGKAHLKLGCLECGCELECEGR